MIVRALLLWQRDTNKCKALEMNLRPYGRGVCVEKIQLSMVLNPSVAIRQAMERVPRVRPSVFFEMPYFLKCTS